MKIHRAYWVLVVAALTAAGCGQHRPITGITTVTLAMTGSVGDGFIGNTPTRRSIELNQVVETHGIIAFKAAKAQSNQNYRAILGATPGRQKSAEGHFCESSLWFQLDHGWVYLYGQGPLVKTTRISGGAHGLMEGGEDGTILFQIEETATGETGVHRVFNLNPLGSTSFTITDSANVKHTLPPQHYFETADGGLGDPKRISDLDPADPIAKFLEDVKALYEPFTS